MYIKAPRKSLKKIRPIGPGDVEYFDQITFLEFLDAELADKNVISYLLLREIDLIIKHFFPGSYK